MCTALRLLLIASACTFLGAAPSSAVPITYTEEATASGSLGGVPFTNAAVVISMTADTSTAGSGVNPRRLADGTPVAQYDVTLNVAGSEATFIQSGNTIVQAGTIPLGSDFFVGFQENLGSGGGTILATGTSFSYDLTTPVSLAGQGLIGLGLRLPDGSVGFPTNAGTLNLRGPVGTSTFTATVSGDPHFTTIVVSTTTIKDWVILHSLIRPFPAISLTSRYKPRPMPTAQPRYQRPPQCSAITASLSMLIMPAQGEASSGSMAVHHH
jgi:hypothetical protein